MTLATLGCRLARSLLLAVAVLGLLVGHIVLRGEREMSLSDQAFHKGDLAEALVRARRAAVLYVPGAPHTQDGYARLVAIAVGSESTGDMDMARRAWQAVRACALETQHFWIPQRVHLGRANRRLAVLGFGKPDASGSRVQDGSDGAVPLPETATRRHTGSIGVLAAGIGMVTLGLAWMAWLGISPQGQVQWLAARRALIFLVVGVLCWTLAVLQA